MQVISQLGTTSHLEGVYLVKTHAVMKTGSSLYGKILAQTACTLDSATIVDPTIENKADAIMKEPSPGSDDKMKNLPIGEDKMKPPREKDPREKDPREKNPPIGILPFPIDQPLPVDGIRPVNGN